MEMSNEIGALAKALSAYQAEAVEPGKEGKNAHTRQTYVTLPSALNAARGPLSKHGLAVSQLVGGDADGVSVTTMLTHESGEWLLTTATLPPDKGAGRNAVQAMGSSITYLRRYSLLAILGLSDDSDDDGRASVTTAAKQSPKPAPSRPGHEDADAAIASMSESAEAVARFTRHLRAAPNADELQAIKRDLGEARGDLTDAQILTLANEYKAAAIRLGHTK